MHAHTRTQAEFDCLKEYVKKGGSLLLMLGEGGETRYNTNVNYLIEEFGISINNDCVVRTVYYKYLHPKVVHVGKGVLSKSFMTAAARPDGVGASAGGDAKSGGELKSGDAARGGAAAEKEHAFVYPYGATLNVQKPAVPILSSGFISYPLNRPIAAVYSTDSGDAGKGAKGGKGAGEPERSAGERSARAGRVIVLGSADLFSDEYLQKEDNDKVQDAMFKWLLHQSDFGVDAVEAESAELNEYHHLPDTEALAGRLRSCLQESEELPKDFTKLFDEELYEFNVDVIPEAIALYEKMGVKHETLTLIPPQFECPLPPLQPAVFPPTLREPPPPALDQFDLDEEFAPEKIRLAQVRTPSPPHAYAPRHTRVCVYVRVLCACRPSVPRICVCVAPSARDGGEGQCTR